MGCTLKFKFSPKSWNHPPYLQLFCFSLIFSIFFFERIFFYRKLYYYHFFPSPSIVFFSNFKIKMYDWILPNLAVKKRHKIKFTTNWNLNNQNIGLLLNMKSRSLYGGALLRWQKKLVCYNTTTQEDHATSIFYVYPNTIQNRK